MAIFGCQNTYLEESSKIDSYEYFELAASSRMRSSEIIL